jgi:hypothetical protein
MHARQFARLVLERLGREEQQLKHLGLHAQAAGVRTALTAMLKELDTLPEDQPSHETAPPAGNPGLGGAIGTPATTSGPPAAARAS